MSLWGGGVPMSLSFLGGTFDKFAKLVRRGENATECRKIFDFV